MCAFPETYTRRYRPTEPAVPESRRMLDAYLRLHELAHIRDDARTVLSELVTNAIRYTPQSACVAVRLRRTPCGNLLIDVWDPCPLEPVRCNPRPLDENGRGLAIVRALSLHLQVCPFGGGKYVRAELAG